MESLDFGSRPSSPVARVSRSFAFIDLCGFTAYTSDNGDDAAVDTLAIFRSIVRRVASQKGVRIAKWLGDGAMLVGIQTELLVEAIVEMQDAVQHSKSDLALHCGIAEGLVIMFEGDDYIGAPVNLAARLCDLANPHQVLAPKEIVSSMMVNTEATDLGSFDVPGLSRPVEVVSLERA